MILDEIAPRIGTTSSPNLVRSCCLLACLLACLFVCRDLMLICVGMGNYKSPYTRCFHFRANGFILFASALFSAAICVLDYLRERQRSPSLFCSSIVCLHKQLLWNKCWDSFWQPKKKKSHSLKVMRTAPEKGCKRWRILIAPVPVGLS